MLFSDLFLSAFNKKSEGSSPLSTNDKHVFTIYEYEKKVPNEVKFPK